MKHLKKILIALTILTLLVSAAVVVISAEDGSVDELRTLYNRVDANYSDGKGKSEQLTRAYTYLTEKPIAPDAEGFAELLAEMQAKSVEVAGMLYKEVLIGFPEGSIDNLNAVYAHFEKCPPAEDTPGYAEMLAQLMADNAAIIEDCYNLATNASTPVMQARVYLTSLFEQLAYKPLDEENDEYATLLAQCKAAALAAADAIYADYLANAAGEADTDEKYLARYNAAGTLKYFLTQVVLPDNADAKAMIQNSASAYKAAAAEKQARLEALDSVADFGSYDLTEYRQVINLEEGKAFSAINPNATNYGEVRTDPETGNKYFTLVQGAESSHLYVEPQNKTDELGLVHNVDMMFSDNFYGCEFVTREPSIGMGSLFQFIDADRSGDIELQKLNCGVYLNGGTSSIKGLVTPNVWFTLSVTFDYNERTGSVYVNYVKVMDINYTQYKFTGFRIGKSGTHQEISLDNYDVYQGTDIRIWDKFEKMNDEQKFMFYVDYFTNSEYNPTNRNNAYLKARELIQIVPDSDTLTPYKDRFIACNYEDDIKKPAMALNLESIKAMVKELPTTVTSETRADVALQLQAIDDFIAKNNELINRADNSEGGYLAQVAILDAMRTAIERVIDAEDFITAVSKFKRATSYASMSKHAAVAESIWVKAGYAFDENGEINANIGYVANDPVVLAFEKDYLNDKDVLPEDENYKTVFEYYMEFAATIAERVKYENSKRIIDCISFITSLDGYEPTEEFWSENIDYISKYVTIIRDLIYARNVEVANNFDLSYAGLSYALETFYTIDEYCYKALQQEHVAVISEQLEKFVSTDSYIEKTGICTYLNAYIAENELAVYLDEDDNFIYNEELVANVREAVAPEVAELENLLYVYIMYSGELEAQEADYAAVLAANTQYFIDTVKVLTSVVTYTEKAEILDLASLYYYSMNVDSEEAQEAIEIYNTIYDEVLGESLVARDFMINALTIALLGEADEEELEDINVKETLYSLLIEGSYIRSDVNAEIPGVPESIEIFDAAIENYNQTVQKVNSDIAEVNGITCAVRTNSVLYAALAVIAGFVK